MKLSDEAAALLAAQYVFGGLTPRVRRAVERRVPRDRRLAAEVRRWHELAADLSASTAAAEIPAGVWQRIAAQLPGVAPARDAARQPPGASWWRRLWVWQSWAAAAAALALAVGVLPMLHRAPLNEPLVTADSVATPAPAPTPSTTAQPAAVPAAVAGRAGAGTGKPAPATTPPTVGAAEASTDHSTVVSRDRAAVASDHRAETGPNARTASADGANGAREVPAARAGIAAPPAARGAATNSAATAPQAEPVPGESARPNRRDRAYATRGIGGTGTAAGATVSVLESRQGGRAWQVRLDDGRDELLVTVLAPQNPGEARNFALWAIPDDGGAPQAIGVIAGDRDVALPLDRRTRRSVRMAQALAVSIEPVGGPAGDGPTGPVSYSGRVDRL